MPVGVKCSDTSGSALVIAFIYFSNTLIKMAENCADGYGSYFPSTKLGINFVINEFNYKRQVVLKISNGKYLTSVNASGFQKALKQLIDNSGTTQGL